MGQKLFYRGDFNKNHRSGFPQSSKRKPVEKYDNKFNSKNGPNKQSIIPTYQTLDQFIIGQKGSSKKCDYKNGVSQFKNKLAEKFNPKNESKKQSMISSYQIEESEPISDFLDKPLSQETQFFQKICTKFLYILEFSAPLCDQNSLRYLQILSVVFFFPSR